jgi:hypothetical protein
MSVSGCPEQVRALTYSGSKAGRIWSTPMNAPVTIQDAVILHTITEPLYTVVIQYHSKRARAYITCESMASVRDTIKRHERIKDVTYIFYSIPELQKIDAYDARDPDRYV